MDFNFPDLTVSRQQPAVSKHTTSTLDERIEVFVLTHGNKPSVTRDTLATLGIHYTPFVNPDWEFPADHPELLIDRSARPSIRDYALRQYRAFKGHQAILRQADQQRCTLVFEDDASLTADTTPEEVVQHCNAAARLLSGADVRYDAVSFHGRRQSPPVRSVALYSREYVELGPRGLRGREDSGHVYFLRPVINNGYAGKYAKEYFRWHEGCLAYMVGQTGRKKWLDAGHGGGMPCDLFLVNELNTIVMRDTIFHHDQRYGSLISNTVKRVGQ